MTWNKSPSIDPPPAPPSPELLCATHGYVRALTEAFCDEELKRGLTLVETVPPSPDEVRRIFRAMYRYLLLCRVWRELSESMPRKRWIQELLRLAEGYTSWECEELKKIVYFFHVRVHDRCREAAGLALRQAHEFQALRMDVQVVLHENGVHQLRLYTTWYQVTV